MIKLEHFAGRHIETVCKEAISIAGKNGDVVEFDFNGTRVIATALDSADALVEQWEKDSRAAAEAYRNSPEYKERVRREEQELKRAMSAQMKETADTEAQMREADVPWPYTTKQLVQYINSLTERQHDYGTSAYAMSMAAVAAFNYVGKKLGTTGFQSSCADMDILRRTRHTKGPFIILDLENALYPQYDLFSKLAEALKESEAWLKERAKAKLAENGTAHPDVIAHWKRLAEGK